MEGLRARRLHHRHGYREYPQSEPDAENDPDGKVYKFLSFTGSGRDIADPWYTGDFEATYRDVVEGCNGFLAYLRREGKI